MIKKFAILSLLFVAAVLKVEGQTVINVTGATGTFGPKYAEYTNGLNLEYRINIGSSTAVKVQLSVDTELNYDYVKIYETNSDFTVLTFIKQISGKTLENYTSTNSTGKLVIRVTSDGALCSDGGMVGLIATYPVPAVAPDNTSIPQISNNFPATGPIKIGGVTTTPNVTIQDISEKVLWNSSTSTPNYNNALIDIISGKNGRLGIASDAISSMQSFSLTTPNILNLYAQELRYSSTAVANALKITWNGYIRINNPDADVSGILNAKFNANTGAFLMFNDPTKKYGCYLSPLGSIGSNFSTVLGTKTIDNAPSFYLNAQHGGTSTNGRGIIVLDGRMGTANWGNSAAPANQKVVEITSSWGNTLAYVTGEGSFYVKKDLFVPGLLQASEVKVTVTTPNTADFVFDENYELRPLAEVQTFITTNKHLPDVPSASNMVENGVDLAQMNKVLLQKIEELTLYVINQENRIKQLEKK